MLRGGAAVTGDPSLRPASSEPILGMSGEGLWSTWADQVQSWSSRADSRLPLGLKEPRQGNGHHTGTSLTFEEILRACSFHSPSYLSSSQQLSPIIIPFLTA